MRRLAFILLLLPAACGGGENVAPPVPVPSQQPANREAVNHREAMELQKRAQALMVEGDYTGAAELAERALKLAPQEATVHDQLGYIYEALLRYDDALDAFTRAMELFGADVPNWTRTHASYCAHRLALEASNRGEYDKALAFVKRAIELKSGDSGLHTLQGDLHYSRGEFAAAAESYGAAADFAVGEGVYAALSKKGESQFHAGHYRPAIETFTRMIDDGIDGYEAYGWRAYCWFQIGKKPEAESDFNQAALRTPDTRKRAEYEAALKALAEAK